VSRWAVFDLNGTLIARQTVRTGVMMTRGCPDSKARPAAMTSSLQPDDELITQREVARTPLCTSQGRTRQGNTDLSDLRAPTGAEPHKIGRAESAS
jgi:hypothetical protein